MPAPSFGLWYDFRNPPQWRTEPGPLYRDTIEQIVWAEQLGFRSAWLSEHHFTEDDYAASPMVIAATIGARTSSMRIGSNIIVAGLHNPIRIAEDATALALLTGDRFDLGVGLGYHESEFEAFGRRVKQRPSLLEDAVTVIRRAWSGSDEAYEGKRFTMPAAAVTPVPPTPPKLLIGAQSPVGVDRAARLADGVITLSNAHCEWYLDAIATHAKDPKEAAIYASQWAIVADDPERVWSRIGDRALYQMNKYIEWGSFEGPDQPDSFPDPQSLLDAGAYRLMDASMAVEELVGLATQYPQIKDFHYWAQLPGEPIDSGSERIQYLADKVIPEVTRQLNGQPAMA
jgi:alkanesulfonate monooxygenase SsuD/methylene tetrahydromethanopterin reductase-like flavin-dependent oxidoreductase (luciferase family)